jgi:hypothetical protein
MATDKCPLCDCPCIIRIIATSDERWCKVDVCEMCGTMYPRDKKAVLKAPAVRAKKSVKGVKKGSKKGKKRAK